MSTPSPSTHPTMTVLGSVVLPGIEPAVAVVRRFIRTAAGPGFPGLYDLTVVASELFSNAVRHSRSGRRPGRDGVGQVIVTLLTGDGTLRLEMTDQGGGGTPRLRTPEDGGESGRGLHVVEALALSWGAQPDGARTVVWAEFAWPARCTVPQAGSRGA